MPALPASGVAVTLSRCSVASCAVVSSLNKIVLAWYHQLIHGGISPLRCVVLSLARSYMAEVFWPVQWFEVRVACWLEVTGGNRLASEEVVLLRFMGVLQVWAQYKLWLLVWAVPMDHTSAVNITDMTRGGCMPPCIKRLKQAMPANGSTCHEGRTHQRERENYAEKGGNPFLHMLRERALT